MPEDWLCHLRHQFCQDGVMKFFKPAGWHYECSRSADDVSAVVRVETLRRLSRRDVLRRHHHNRQAVYGDATSYEHFSCLLEASTRLYLVRIDAIAGDIEYTSSSGVNLIKPGDTRLQEIVDACVQPRVRPFHRLFGKTSAELGD